MLNYFLKMGSGDRLTPTFIIEPKILLCLHRRIFCYHFP
jgi:hypothetical protein